jgi:regulator of sigma E protease
MIAIDGQPIEKWRDLEQIISKSPEKTLAITVDRAGQKVTLNLTPAATETKNIFGKTSKIGRAGIALGMLPPVIRVLALDSPANSAGLKTGDRILSVIWNGQKRDIKSYPEFQASIVSMASSPVGPSDITLEVASYSHDSETLELGSKDSEETTREINLSLLPARASIANTTQGIGGSEGRQLMRALGVGDGQLTVGELPSENGKPNPAAGALRAGDTLLTMDGKPLKDLFALREALMANNSQVVPFEIIRNFQEVTVSVSLEGVETQKPEGVATVYVLPVVFMGSPIEPEPLYEVYKNPFSAILYGVKETGRQTSELTANVVQLITGEVPLKALGGPMLIAKVAGESARRGWQTFLGSMALISVNLGLLNLFPIPVLDGGQLVMMGIEGIRRRPLSEVAIENFQKIGFAMIMGLVVLATYNDLSRFWKSMLSSVVGMFQ